MNEVQAVDMDRRSFTPAVATPCQPDVIIMQVPQQSYVKKVNSVTTRLQLFTEVKIYGGCR